MSCTHSPFPSPIPGPPTTSGQSYGGPVVCIADARTYSSGDLFAAGFVDNDIGPLITVGSGHRRRRRQRLVVRAAAVPAALAGLLPAELPAGCSFTFSFRRATRAGGSEGRPIEDVGVAGALEYDMTRRDVLNGNVDLLATAVDVLASQRHSRMEVAAPRSGRPLSIRAVGDRRAVRHLRRNDHPDRRGRPGHAPRSKLSRGDGTRSRSKAGARARCSSARIPAVDPTTEQRGG